MADLPPQVAISQIPTLVWLIFGRPGLGRSTPSLSRSQMTISQIPNLSPHIWQTRSWKFHLPIKQWFHRFLLWELIFGRSGLDISTPIPHRWLHRFLLWGLIFGRPGHGRSSIPPPNSDFTDSNSEGPYLVGQVLADLPPPLNAPFTDSYSESSYLA